MEVRIMPTALVIILIFFFWILSLLGALLANRLNVWGVTTGVFQMQHLALKRMALFLLIILTPFFFWLWLFLQFNNWIFPLPADANKYWFQTYSGWISISVSFYFGLGFGFYIAIFGLHQVPWYTAGGFMLFAIAMIVLWDRTFGRK